jgi:hypothetical protein
LTTLPDGFYKPEIAVVPAVYNIYFPAAVICKNKERLIQKLHLHGRLVGAHGFQFKTLVFDYPAAFRGWRGFFGKTGLAFGFPV